MEHLCLTPLRLIVLATALSALGACASPPPSRHVATFLSQPSYVVANEIADRWYASAAHREDCRQLRRYLILLPEPSAQERFAQLRSAVILVVDNVQIVGRQNRCVTPGDFEGECVTANRVTTYSFEPTETVFAARPDNARALPRETIVEEANDGRLVADTFIQPGGRYIVFANYIDYREVLLTNAICDASDPSILREIRQAS